MMGGEMRENDDWTLSLLTNGEVLRLNKHSFDARQLELDSNRAAWLSHDADGSVYIALFNLSDERAEVSVEDSVCGFEPRGFRDLWHHREVTMPSGRIAAHLPPHGASLYKIS
jgi:hypothetical protein